MMPFDGMRPSDGPLSDDTLHSKASSALLDSIDPCFGARAEPANSCIGGGVELPSACVIAAPAFGPEPLGAG
jgi:hypothetical protein